MKNQQGDSLTHRVRQNAPVFPLPDTINPSPTPEWTTSTTRFLEMSRAALRGEVVETGRPAPPPDKGFQRRPRSVPAPTPSVLTSDQGENPHAPATLQEITQRRAKSKAHQWAARKPVPTTETPAGEDSPPTPAAWLLDGIRAYEEHEAQVKAERTQIFVNQRVQRQPLPALMDLIELMDFRPKRGKGAGTAGAGALAALLHDMARVALATRLYLYDKDGNPPRQILIHQSAEMIAKALGICDNTLREWTAQLQAVGFLYARAHYTTTTLEGERMTAIDGMLYAIRLAPGHIARLRYSDYKRQYRDLDADRAAGRTAYNAIANAQRRMEEAQILECVQDGENFIEGSRDSRNQMQAEMIEQLRRWAVIPGNITTQDPLKADPAIIGPDEVERRLRGVQDVVFMLSTLLDVHKSKRAALIGMMGAALARDLNDAHSRLYYCKVIWQAWQAEIEGRDGLQALAAELQRLEVDRREWKGLRRPAALLAARLRAV